MTKEQFSGTISPPSPHRPKQPTVKDKALEVLGKEGPVELQNFTTALPVDLLQWITQEATAEFRKRYPNQPKLTKQELTRVAFRLLQQQEDPFAVVIKERNN